MHPYHLDSVSSSFATKIELLASVSDTMQMIKEMLEAYCSLATTYSLKQYSPLIQTAVTLIDSDLSADLTLHTIAKQQNISSGYLSSLFKKETGLTLTDFIRNRRVQHACTLLETTHLQIQTIAIHCGIPDLQYFSKTFKRCVGLTPKEYRDTIRVSAK